MNSVGIDASIKWPNDVWVGERKLAGILTEMSSQGQKLAAVIVGIGVNVNQIEFPAELAATSMRLETGREHDREEVLRAVAARLGTWLDRYLRAGVEGLSSAFEQHSMLADRTVRARVDGVMVEGTAMGLDHDGSLLLRDDEGRTHRVLAGEVELVGAAP
jgi:BirA family biotin operon repressor/biotin-[acetyl-CoA-carboxylase] ligase